MGACLGTYRLLVTAWASITGTEAGMDLGSCDRHQPRAEASRQLPGTRGSVMAPFLTRLPESPEHRIGSILRGFFLGSQWAPIFASSIQACIRELDIQ